jgi:hypothetical protein
MIIIVSRKGKVEAVEMMLKEGAMVVAKPLRRL